MLNVAWLNQNAAAVGNDFARAADLRGNYRQSSVERFNERNSEWFGIDIGLAEDVCGGKQPRNVRLLTGKANPIGKAQLLSAGNQFVEVAHFVWPLRPADDPTNPAV